MIKGPVALAEDWDRKEKAMTTRTEQTYTITVSTTDGWPQSIKVAHQLAIAAPELLAACKKAYDMIRHDYHIESEAILKNLGLTQAIKKAEAAQ